MRAAGGAGAAGQVGPQVHHANLAGAVLVAAPRGVGAVGQHQARAGQRAMDGVAGTTPPVHRGQHVAAVNGDQHRHAG